MSAFLCDEQHIGQLAIKIWSLTPWNTLERSARDVASSMAHENIVSLESRYSDDIDFFLGDMTVEEYIRGCQDATKALDLNLTPIDFVKMAQCYAYQSCEHPAWESCKPKVWAEWIQYDFIRSQPEYKDAVYSYDGRDANLVSNISLLGVPSFLAAK